MSSMNNLSRAQEMLLYYHRKMQMIQKYYLHQVNLVLSSRKTSYIFGGSWMSYLITRQFIKINRTPTPRIQTIIYFVLSSTGSYVICQVGSNHFLPTHFLISHQAWEAEISDLNTSRRWTKYLPWHKLTISITTILSSPSAFNLSLSSIKE